MKTLKSTLILAIIFCLTFSCEEDDISSDAINSVLPAELFSYKLVFHITDVVSNPGGLSVSSTNTYQFINETTVLGVGDNITLPVESWRYTNDSAGGVFDLATISLNYGSLGNEEYDITFDGEQSDLESRQTFVYFGTLLGSSVQTVGYFTIEEIN